MIRHFSTLLLTLALVAGSQTARCQSPPANSTTPKPMAVSPPHIDVPDTAAAVKAIIDKTNAFRRENGLEKLAVNADLTLAARHFAEFMAANAKYGHDADGRHAEERAVKVGYDYCLIGENIAYQYDPVGFTTKRLAEGFVEGWEKSPEHRRNMLNPDVTEVGMGIARSEVNGHYYAVQMVGRPKSLAINFEVNNKSDISLECRIGSEKFSLPANSHRKCEVCRPETLIIHFPSDKKKNLTTRTMTLKPANGDQLVITNGDEGFQIKKE
jgi:uncharacterized protein YkwD